MQGERARQNSMKCWEPPWEDGLRGVHEPKQELVEKEHASLESRGHCSSRWVKERVPDTGIEE